MTCPEFYILFWFEYIHFSILGTSAYICIVFCTCAPIKSLTSFHTMRVNFVSHKRTLRYVFLMSTKVLILFFKTSVIFTFGHGDCSEAWRNWMNPDVKRCSETFTKLFWSLLCEWIEQPTPPPERERSWGTKGAVEMFNLQGFREVEPKHSNQVTSKIFYWSWKLFSIPRKWSAEFIFPMLS